MSTAMIDSSPNERAGVGVYNGFRERDKSKEIQPHSFTLYSPSKIKTFDNVQDTSRVYNSTLQKNIKKFERTRHKRASSVLSTYSDQLRHVMEKLPINKIVPPIQGAGAAVMLQKQMKQGKKVNKTVMDNKKTFFKGATSFIM